MENNIKEVNKVIGLDWDKCYNYELEEDTKDFVNRIVNKYYDKVYLGLIDHSYNEEDRKNMFKELLNVIGNKDCILYQHINNCINDIKNESNCENLVIIDIFKLQHCKDIKWY